MQKKASCVVFSVLISVSMVSCTSPEVDNPVTVPPQDKKVNRLWIAGSVYSQILAKAVDEYGSHKVVTDIYGHPEATSGHENIPFTLSNYDILTSSQVLIEDEDGEFHVETDQEKWDLSGQHGREKTLDMLYLTIRNFDVEWCSGQDEAVLATDFADSYLDGPERRFETREEYTEDIIEYVNCGTE
ncbi:hypothetical protein ACWGSK_06695 [Nocardiopsis sp. NPDC055551]